MSEETMEKMDELLKELNDLRNETKSLRDEIAGLKQDIGLGDSLEEEEIPSQSMAVIHSMDETTDDDDVKVEALCRWAAARAGVIVVAPLVGTVALMANEVYLINRIARVYDIKLSERTVLAFIGAIGSRMAGNLLTTLIPIGAVQVPIAVGITYSLGKVTQRWLKDGMPSDMGPYVDMMGEWKDKAKEQVDKLRENPLQNIPLGDETADFMKKWGGAAKDAFKDMKEKGQEAVHTIRHRNDLVEEVAAEQAKEQAAEEAPEPAATTEEQVKAAVEEAKAALNEEAK
jgi:uncharacterized protein (DUF697 family)